MARKVTKSQRKRPKGGEEPSTGKPVTDKPASKDPAINEPAVNESDTSKSAAGSTNGQPQKNIGFRIDKGIKEHPKDVAAQDANQNVPQDVGQEVSPRIDVEMKGLEDLVFGVPSLIQSSLGNMGNFELVVPLADPGLAYLWRDNDNAELPWYGPQIFGTEAGRFGAASLIQSCFGEYGNLELVATDLGGHRIIHFWRDAGPKFEWHGPNFISEESYVPVFSGNPSLIQSTYGNTGNFDLVIPLAEGGMTHYWRDNDDPALPWYGPFDFGHTTIYNAVCMIQSNFGDKGNLELVAMAGDDLAFFWRDSGPEHTWNGPTIIATGAFGCPSMIQSSYGRRGTFEVVTPMVSGGLAHYWRDNDDPALPWYGPYLFGARLGKVDAVTLIQSNFGPGNLELIARVDSQLAHFWKDTGPDFKWNGPFFIDF